MMQFKIDKFNCKANVLMYYNISYINKLKKMLHIRRPQTGLNAPVGWLLLLALSYVIRPAIDD